MPIYGATRNVIDASHRSGVNIDDVVAKLSIDLRGRLTDDDRWYHKRLYIQEPESTELSGMFG